MLKIYVASSWRNDLQNEVVEMLRNDGHEVYDFKNPRKGEHGFHWSEIDQNWKQWTAQEFHKGLQHEIASRGFLSDFNAMLWANTFVLVNPCGRSAHLELGWAIGMGKRAIILLRDGDEPELMYNLLYEFAYNLKMLSEICKSVPEEIREPQ